MLEETQLIQKGYQWDDVEQWWVREWTTNNGSESILEAYSCLLYTSPSPRDGLLSRMPSSA